MWSGVTWSSHQFLQVVQQSKAFLIGHRGEGVIGVDVLQTGDQVGQRVVGSKCVHLKDDANRRPLKQADRIREELFIKTGSGSHRVLQVLPAPNGFKLSELFTLHTPANHPLQVHCVTLIQPEDDRNDQ